MALAIRLEELIHEGSIASEAEVARLTNLDRGVISRLLNLRLLAPEIQESILFGQCPDWLRIKHIMELVREVDWVTQCISYENKVLSNIN
ncbi:MAG: hypothetical protein AB3N10_16925 [Allomuricauda sp.]